LPGGRLRDNADEQILQQVPGGDEPAKDWRFLNYISVKIKIVL
jgi:hypothetical protein